MALPLPSCRAEAPGAGYPYLQASQLLMRHLGHQIPEVASCVLAPFVRFYNFVRGLHNLKL